jgi:dephospho-CoA kinase
MIPVIGIVGGIGSGKSAVADAMRRLGGRLISADDFGHEALRQPDIKAQLIKRWGNQILDPQGNPDRKMVGRIVFENTDELRALENLVFPFIEKKINQEITSARADAGVKWIILDAAIMIETGWHRQCDRIVFVDAPRELRLARVKEQRGWVEKELERRECMQMPLDEKKDYAHVIIVNDGDFEKVSRQAQDALEQWKVIC